MNLVKKTTGLGVRLQGHLKILQYTDHEAYAAGRSSRVLLNKRNAVHKENAVQTVVRALTDRDNKSVFQMVFGNGGTTLDQTGTITFKPPNAGGSNADLYNPVFFQVVDDTRGALSGNQMAIRHISGSQFTDIDIRCLIDSTQPFGQLPNDEVQPLVLKTTDDPESPAPTTQFYFDEIGLKLQDGTLLTHVIFTPILKTGSSLLEVVYTLRIAIGNAGEGAGIDSSPIPGWDSGLQVNTQAGTIYLPTQQVWRYDPNFGAGIGAPYAGTSWGSRRPDVDTGFTSAGFTTVGQNTFMPITGSIRVRAKTYFTKFIVTTYHIDAIFMRIVFTNSTIPPYEVSTTTDITDTDQFLATETPRLDAASHIIDNTQPFTVHMEIRADGTTGLGGGNILPSPNPMHDPSFHLDDAYFIVEWWSS